MPERSSRRSRAQIARKRGVVRRAKVREMVAASGGEKRPAHAKRRPAKR